MEDFWKSVQTIQAERGADYRAFSLFSATHWAELLGAAAVIFLCAVIYYRCREVTRHQILRAVFVLMLADEFMKQTVLLYTGQRDLSASPPVQHQHLCLLVRCHTPEPLEQGNPLCALYSGSSGRNVEPLMAAAPGLEPAASAFL